MSTGGGAQTIRPTSNLPTITGHVVIDGGTQPGVAGTPLIELNGGNDLQGDATGLTITAGHSAVRMLVINGFRRGIVLASNGGNIIAGNYIGTDVTGTRAVSNGTGVDVSSGNNLIGGTAPGAGNLIAGNGLDGILVRGPDNLIQGNFVGTDVTGTRPLGNGSDGVEYVGAANTTVGGTTAGAGNLIAANRSAGIDINRGGGGNVVQGNFIGTDVTGTRALGNGFGVLLDGAGTGNRIGGTAPGAGNLISGNLSFGIIDVGASPDNLIQGNFVGTDVTGTRALGNDVGIELFSSGTVVAGNLVAGNRGDGIELAGSRFLVQGNAIGTDFSGALPLGNRGNGIHASGWGNLIGGTAAGAGNVIAFNGRDGVRINGGTFGSSDNAILRNRIFGHDNGLGIELVNGGNHNQAAPVLTAATTAGDTTTVAGTLTGAPDTTFTVELFISATCNPSGYGEGERFLAALTVTTDDDGYAALTLAVAVGVRPGQFVTATATDPGGNTSAFSRCVGVTEGGTLGLPYPGPRREPATLPNPALRYGASGLLLAVAPALVLGPVPQPALMIPGPSKDPVPTAGRHTHIAGNFASTSDDDVFGDFSDECLILQRYACCNREQIRHLRQE
jgi:titin